MHSVEYVLTLYVDGIAVCLAVFLQILCHPAVFAGDVLGVDQHKHSKDVIAHNGLGNVQNIGTVAGYDAGNVMNNALFVLAQDGNDCTHSDKYLRLNI